ncbi:hypothetical protein BLOT_014114 [Blomia tropicalis]|nr:hypothetical protein BLOT_014114 [Blomia tropicalis]
MVQQWQNIVVERPKREIGRLENDAHPNNFNYGLNYDFNRRSKILTEAEEEVFFVLSHLYDN